MPFPVYQVPWLGNGMVIAVNAVVHVLISHGLAIGVFFVIALGDWSDRASFGKWGDQWAAYNRRLLKFTVVVVSVAGAVTGAGIWFTTGAFAPRAVGSMLRIFFWPWFIEWIVFLVEIVLLLAIYAVWDRLTERRTLRSALAVAYLLVALTSAILITGILGFMLTSGEWPRTRSFWDAFLNPTFAPQLLTRLALSTVLGGLVGLLFVAHGTKDVDFRRQVGALCGAVVAVSGLVFAVGLSWYIAELTPGVLGPAVFSVMTSHGSQSPGLWAGANLLGGVLVLATGSLAMRSMRIAGWMVIPAIVAFAGIVAQFERIREFVRGPYLMPGYMYVSGLLLEEESRVRSAGVLAAAPWAVRAAEQGDSTGAAVFAANCAACHTVDGLNSIRRRLAGRSEQGIYVLLGRTHEMISFMPPFLASEPERRETARFLFDLSRGDITMDRPSRMIPHARRPTGT